MEGTTVDAALGKHRWGRKRYEKREKSQEPTHAMSLLVPQGLNRIEPGGAGRWIQAGEQADDDGERNRASYQPPGYEPDLFRSEVLAAQVDIRTQVDHPTDSPSQSHAQRAAQGAHHSCLGEENLLHIDTARADGFHDPNFAPPLQNRHHQRIHDSDRGDSQSQAPKDAEEQVEHGKEAAHAA